jgi:hypothetical protein
MLVSGIPTFDQIRCGFALPGALLILFWLGAREDRRRASLGLAAVQLGVVSLLFTDSVLDVTKGPFDPGALFPLVLCAAVWGLGRMYRARSVLLAELAGRGRALEEARARTSQLAVEAERIRLTGVLDAAVRERIGEIVRLARDGDPGDARKVFEAIEREARESLHRLRQVLGVLHG